MTLRVTLRVLLWIVVPFLVPWIVMLMGIAFGPVGVLLAAYCVFMLVARALFPSPALRGLRAAGGHGRR